MGIATSISIYRFASIAISIEANGRFFQLRYSELFKLFYFLSELNGRPTLKPIVWKFKCSIRVQIHQFYLHDPMNRISPISIRTKKIHNRGRSEELFYENMNFVELQRIFTLMKWALMRTIDL